MTSRERFEQSGITSLLSRSTEPGFTDEYADSHTQFAWRAWQAAERQALERAAQYFDDSGDPEGATMIRRMQDAQSGEDQK